ncbi:MAG: copper resistance protein CopC [Micrococcales bacterium]|nr:copper resistance protein CopC [Micrococcales bacterium]
MPAPFRRLWALLAMALLAVTAVTPAVAHTDLVSSDPADGQTLSAPPEQLTLRFGEDILDGGARVVAEDDRGAKVALGPVQVAGPDLIATWPQTAAAGKYTVAWRAVSDDGHPLEGTFAFTVTSADESPTPDIPTADPSPVADDQAQGTGVNLAVPGLFVIGLVAVGLIVWRSRAD